jgi:hypothetical protein
MIYDFGLTTEVDNMFVDIYSYNYCKLVTIELMEVDALVCKSDIY